MYDSLDDARTHAHRATRLYRHDITLAQLGAHYALYGDSESVPPEATVLEVVPYEAPAPAE